MWGCISMEATYQLGYNTGFSSTRSHVILHLAQWQYWWWFWFTFLWCLYFLLIGRVIRYRTLKTHPKIVTSYRSHGKWGDFLAGVIPVIWCVNILTNSNFILRLLEWQTESGLFTIRIRAKQWYWIYKFDLKSLTDILGVPRNVGINKWKLTTAGGVVSGANYLNLLDIKKNSVHAKALWAEWYNRDSTPQHYLDQGNKLGALSLRSSELGMIKNQLVGSPVTVMYSISERLKMAYCSKCIGIVNQWWNSLSNPKLIPINVSKILWSSDDSVNAIFVESKRPNSDNLSLQTPEFVVIKQKKYTRQIGISGVYISNNLISLNNSFDTQANYLASYKLTQSALAQGEVIPISLNLRLLRAKRTLVLPAHVNITLITNSYDIIHSWFVPGLGIKLDCVPGRSTHHTFFIDNVGFYFGQCAEICGRYHHHMPIRVCALPFEHFLVWWYTFGVSKLHFSGHQPAASYDYHFYRFCW